MTAALELTRFLARARRLLVFTGAGVSTGSGIPDFRGPGGVWSRRVPVYFDEFLASESKRLEYWEYKEEQHETLRLARPNAAHRALVSLETRGWLQAIVTQNIDGLHQLAGSSPGRVLELHGTNRWVECVTCGTRQEPDPVVTWFKQHRRPPACACGGWLKFATVSFGQSLPEDVLMAAFDEGRRADAVLSLGSTLSVTPAATVPLAAASRGVPYGIVNRGPTEHDGVATLRVDADVCDVLPAAVAALDAEPS